MSPLDPSEIQQDRKSGYVKLSALQAGEEITLTVVDVSKLQGAKFPVRGETWCYRFTTQDGRTWDCNTKSLYGSLLAWLYPDGKTFTPVTVKVTKKSGLLKRMESPYGIKQVERPSA